MAQSDLSIISKVLLVRKSELSESQKSVEAGEYQSSKEELVMSWS
jgi:hypothetical protein